MPLTLRLYWNLGLFKRHIKHRNILSISYVLTEGVISVSHTG